MYRPDGEDNKLHSGGDVLQVTFAADQTLAGARNDARCLRS
jgi:hypothetical protein